MPLSPIDFEEIKQLHARYCHTLDFGDIDGLVSCFAPDGGFEIALVPGHPATRRGTEALRRSPAGVNTTGHGRHTTLGSITDGDGDTARSLSAVMMSCDYGPPVGKGQVTRSQLCATGLYADDLVRVDGRWVYADRVFGGDETPAVVRERVAQRLTIAPVDAGEATAELSPLDHEAIRQLLARAGFALDLADDDAFAECFIPDATIDAPDPAQVGGRVHAQGRDQLREYATAVREELHGFARQTALGPVIAGGGARARVSAYALTTVSYGAAPQPRQRRKAEVLTTGVYRDEVVKVDGRWLFAQRTLRTDMLPEVRALVGRPSDLRLLA